MKFIFDLDTWQEIYSSIRKNKIRTAITIIGVMWGIFLLVVLLGAAKGVENNFNKIFGSFATNSVFIWAQSTSEPFKGFQEGRRLTLKMTDLASINSEIKGLEFVVPRHQTQAVATNNFKSGTFGIYGDYPELDKIQKKDMVWGRFINHNDILENKKVCVIEEEIYKQLFDKEEYPIGQYIKINSINYKLVGMYKEGALRTGGPQGSIHIPFTTFQQVYNRGNSIGWLTITGKSGFDISQIETDVKLLLKNLHQVNPEDNRAFGSFNLGKEIAKVTGFLTGMQFLTWFVGIATLIAGVFAIGNILLITVKERTKEIGIRRALGAKPWEIKRQIILESVFLTGVAGALGIIAGGLVLMIIDATMGKGDNATLSNPTVNVEVILIAFATLMILGTLIGLIPAQRAVSIKPIEALREE
ncbi:MAG: multidrug ABC transporter ATP-binding protein [Flavobacteriales bacterium CG_4_9_14_0_2_um_filter_35_242]|nr:ABC transporter permease [Zetaproteobacteria bacterium]OIO10314.1 MAG: multidrug ABC transporter ATP-binding protein [Flavobacteriaceae bacterium CG1_02_35_72]PIR14205.1 MAG: multidrug ABC transporter ATP-binding protein [Flavobacteriales bacterium CG11_big_fil_rev_8_21_14_0_20_35_7]PIV15963.1 MAG: multidrug ABC transporter ATP-binding protein [Flavobacteriales bacterium CG03_land_8_20_14_0_80_35_15]PIX06650.1 MAG: multidrug ABC transporter ATP-binding protein [Flavobacteriales bacterium CG_